MDHLCCEEERSDGSGLTTNASRNLGLGGGGGALFLEMSRQSLGDQFLERCSGLGKVYSFRLGRTTRGNVNSLSVQKPHLGWLGGSVS